MKIMLKGIFVGGITEKSGMKKKKNEIIIQIKNKKSN